MSTITVHPKKPPLVLMGDFDVVQPDAFLFSRPEHEIDSEFIRHQYNATQFRGPAAEVIHISDNPIVLSGTVRYTDDRRAYFKRQYGVRTTYHNYTAREVLVIDRLGLPMILQPDSRLPGNGNESPCIIIRQELHFDDKQAMQRTLDALKQMTPIQGKELRQIKEVIQKDVRTTGYYGARLILEYLIPEDDLLEAVDHSAYHHKTDVIISLNSIDEAPRHPASAEYTNTDSPVFNTAPTTQDDVAVLLRYVSNDPKATPKYMRFADKVLKLIPQNDHPAKLTSVIRRDKNNEKATYDERYDYIEFLYPTRVDSDNPKSQGIRCTRIGLDEAKSLYGIFDSLQELTNPQDVLETTNRKLKDKVDFLEQENKRQAKEADEKIKETERAWQEKHRVLNAAHEDLKKEQTLKAEKLKEQRESQAHKQKINFELIKFTANMAAVVIGMIPLLIKVRAGR